MGIAYTTITSKGQITLPAEARRELNLRPGQRVAVRVENGHLVVDPPPSIDDVRAELRSEAERHGTWGRFPHAGDGWAAQAEARSAKSFKLARQTPGAVLV